MMMIKAKIKEQTFVLDTSGEPALPLDWQTEKKNRPEIAESKKARVVT